MIQTKPAQSNSARSARIARLPSGGTIASGRVGAGALSTAIYASTKHELVVVPVLAWAGGLGAAVGIGAVAGLWPALRAARMSPTQALWRM
jgi:putative ABC transport system permease protein